MGIAVEIFSAISTVGRESRAEVPKSVAGLIGTAADCLPEMVAPGCRCKLAPFGFAKFFATGAADSFCTVVGFESRSGFVLKTGGKVRAVSLTGDKTDSPCSLTASAGNVVLGMYLKVWIGAEKALGGVFLSTSEHFVADWATPGRAMRGAD